MKRLYLRDLREDEVKDDTVVNFTEHAPILTKKRFADWKSVRDEGKKAICA